MSPCLVLYPPPLDSSSCACAAGRRPRATSAFHSGGKSDNPDRVFHFPTTDRRIPDRHQTNAKKNLRPAAGRRSAKPCSLDRIPTSPAAKKKPTDQSTRPGTRCCDWLRCAMRVSRLRTQISRMILFHMSSHDEAQCNRNRWCRSSETPMIPWHLLLEMAINLGRAGEQ